jgi:iron complex transport system ATP-binding protein
VLTPDLLREVFALEAEVIPDPTTGTPLVLPVRRTPGPPVVDKTPPVAGYGPVPTRSEGDNSPPVDFSPRREQDR